MIKIKKSTLKKHMLNLVLIGFLLLFLIACTQETRPVYDLSTRVALDEGEIVYEVPEVESYYNYIEVYDDLGNIYQIGDPYVMRYNGTFYLYSSMTGTNYINGAIPVWTSQNLVDWEWGAWVYGQKGQVDDKINQGFAPEVIYYRGYFYLAIAPGGKGHNFFRSESPLGPFELVSNNLGMGFDGSFYVDADGKLYLMHIDGQRGLTYHELTVDADGVTLTNRTAYQMENTNLNGWIEGPGIIERNGVSYIIYTGNDVDVASYRLGYSYSYGIFALQNIVLPQNNILSISTGDDQPYSGGGYNSDPDNYIRLNNYRGIGHNSQVYGPDLDSMYNAYHTAGRSNYTGIADTPNFNRRYNLNRYYTNQSILSTNGYVTYDTPKPKAPDYSTYGLDELENVNDMYVSETTSDIFTAELNLKLQNGNGSVIVGFKDTLNYTKISIEGTDLTATEYVDGQVTILGTSTVSTAMTDGTFHLVRIVNGFAKVDIYYDGAKEISLNQSLGSGKLGYQVFNEVGSTQFSNDAYGTSDFNDIKNLDGTFAAYNYLKGENLGYSLSEAYVKNDGVRQGEAESTKIGADYTSLVLHQNDWVKYSVNAAKAGTYSLVLKVSKESRGTIFEVIIDESNIYKLEIPDIDLGDEEYLYVNAGSFEINESGIHSLKLRVFYGTLDVTQIQPLQNADVIGEFESTLTSRDDESFKKLLGNFSYSPNGMSTQLQSPRSVMYFGNRGISNYDFSVDISTSGGVGGIVFRMKNFDYASQGVNVPITPYSFQGYFIEVTTNFVRITKYNYGQEVLYIGAPKVDGTNAFAGRRTNTISAHIRDSVFMVYLNGELLTTIIDQEAFMDGYIGFYAEQTNLVYSNFKYKQL